MVVHTPYSAEQIHRLDIDHQQLQVLLDIMPDATVIVDATGRMFVVNRQAEQAFGYSREELIGQRVEMLMPAQLAERHAGMRAEYSEHPRTRSMGQTSDLSVQRKDGKHFYADISLSPILINGASFTLASVRDISERKRMEVEVRRLNGHLEDRVKARTAELHATVRRLDLFVSAIGHELRAPLQIVSANVDLLATADPESASASLAGRLDKLRRATREMVDVLNGLMQLAGIDHASPKTDEIDIERTIAEIVVQLRELEGGRNIQVSVEQCPKVHGDPVLIRQLFSNLISNAFKYSRNRDPALISICGWQTPSETHFSISDNGLGFSTSDSVRLFSPFQRLHRERKIEGVGIGLVIARSIVERHGGQIWAVGEPDQGAKFCFTIPHTTAHESYFALLNELRSGRPAEH